MTLLSNRIRSSCRSEASNVVRGNGGTHRALNSTTRIDSSGDGGSGMCCGAGVFWSMRTRLARVDELFLELELDLFGLFDVFVAA